MKELTKLDTNMISGGLISAPRVVTSGDFPTPVVLGPISSILYSIYKGVKTSRDVVSTKPILF